MDADRIEHLAPVLLAGPDRPAIGGPDHPMRAITRETALAAVSWTPARAAEVAAAFDALAPEWSDIGAGQRSEALVDALDRGDVPGGRCLEVGSGTGTHTAVLTARFASVAAVDLAGEMLRRAPAAPAARVQADAVRLPVATATIDALVLVNALLFPAEVARVLAPGGVVVWVNTLGDATPIHLPAADVAAALPGTWQGRASSAGWGTWAVLRRAVDGA